MIIGSDPCKLLAELLSPEEGGGCGVRALVLAGEVLTNIHLVSHFG